MGYVKIYAGLINGDLMPIIEDKSSEDIVKAFTGDDTGAPPRSVTIEVMTENGSKVRICIPNSPADASVTVDGKKVQEPHLRLAPALFRLYRFLDVDICYVVRLESGLNVKIELLLKGIYMTEFEEQCLQVKSWVQSKTIWGRSSFTPHGSSAKNIVVGFLPVDKENEEITVIYKCILPYDNAYGAETYQLSALKFSDWIKFMTPVNN